MIIHTKHSTQFNYNYTRGDMKFLFKHWKIFHLRSEISSSDYAISFLLYEISTVHKPANNNLIGDFSKISDQYLWRCPKIHQTFSAKDIRTFLKIVRNFAEITEDFQERYVRDMLVKGQKLCLDTNVWIQIYRHKWDSISTDFLQIGTPLNFIIKSSK